VSIWELTASQAMEHGRAEHQHLVVLEQLSNGIIEGFLVQDDLEKSKKCS